MSEVFGAIDYARLERRLGLYPQLLASLQTTLTNSGASTASIAVFTSNILVPFSGVLHIQIVVGSSTTARLRLVRGGNTFEYLLNSGNSISANSWYEFSIAVIQGDAVNILIDVPAGGSINTYVALILMR